MTSSAQPSARPDFPGRGLRFGLAAAFFLSAQDAAIKLLSGDYHIMQIIFIRSVFGMLLVLSLLPRAEGMQILRVAKPKLAAARIFFMFGANLCYFISLSKLDLAVYTCIGLTAFLFVTALSGPVLKEKTSPGDWLAVFAGLFGVWLIANPSADAPVDLGAAALLLLGALLWASGITATRALGAAMPAPAILFYSSASLAALSVLFLPSVWRMPPPQDWGLFLLLGFLGACGQGFAVAAYRNARMRTVIPTQHTMLLWAALFAWILWGDAPDWRLCLGGAIIVAASLSALPRSAKKRRSP